MNGNDIGYKSNDSGEDEVEEDSTEEYHTSREKTRPNLRHTRFRSRVGTSIGKTSLIGMVNATVSYVGSIVDDRN